MKFQTTAEAEKIILVISDLHLGAGHMIKGKRNFLEDFHFDNELIEFLQYYSTGEYEDVKVELIINGDFFDFLSVPFVEYFDDEFWSEEASLEKLRMIMRAHSDVLNALKEFIKSDLKKIVYILGNHDAELVFDSLKEEFIEFFSEYRDRIHLSKSLKTYQPVKGVFIQHGHQYEHAHDYDHSESVIENLDGKKFFIPSWGSYYVTNVINKYKQERFFINSVRPIKHFLIHGLLFDTFFTMRFILSNIYYFIMVRFWYFILAKNNFRQLFESIVKELKLFQDYETLTREFFSTEPDSKVLIVGHSHNPTLRIFSDGTTFINTGTWTKMVNLDLGKWSDDNALTYAKILVKNENFQINDFEKNVEVDLKKWLGVHNLPFCEYQ